MSEEHTATAAPAKPAADAAAMAAVEKAVHEVSEAIGLGVLRDMTLALIENTKMIRALIFQIGGAPPSDENPEGIPGLMDQIGDLQEGIDDLTANVQANNALQARQAFIDDELERISLGEPDATPPVPGREPTLADRLAAKRRHEENLAREEEQAEKEAQEAAREAEGPPAEPPPLAKPPMLSNAPRPAPRFRALPPPPLAPPKPLQ